MVPPRVSTSTRNRSVVTVMRSLLNGSAAAGAPGSAEAPAAAAAVAVAAGSSDFFASAALAVCAGAGANMEGLPVETIQLFQRTTSDRANTIHRMVRLLISIRLFVRSGCNRKRSLKNVICQPE